LLFLAVAMLAGCGDNADLPVSAGYGLNPTLSVPKKETIATMHIAPAKGWPARTMPVAPKGFTVTAFARDLDHPRWLYVLPNGDVLGPKPMPRPRPRVGASRAGYRDWS
jgi:glucose/arabinose dehydrogenase